MSPSFSTSKPPQKAPSSFSKLLFIKTLGIMSFACLGAFITTLEIPSFARLSEVTGSIRNFNWELSNQALAPDGFLRNTSLVNGQYPGPLLALNKGDRAFVNVQNALTEASMLRSTSIHWHGIFQPRNAQDDGTSFVTQCPIAPGYSYNYSIAPGEQTGTYWYHSHLGTQYVDGIRGPLVIYDPEDPHKDLYDVDDASTVISLSDWYHEPALELLERWNSSDSVPEPIPDSGLINSAGRYINGSLVPRTRINVQQGKRYRLRILAISATGIFNVSIQDHRMTIIEVEGISVRPYVVDFLPLSSGQRYSVIINANQPIDNYWFSALLTVRGSPTWDENPNFNGSDVFGVIHYAGAPDSEPTSSQIFASGPVQYNETGLVPLIDPGAPGGDAHDLLFNLSFKKGSDNGNVWLINDIQYQPPSVPTLLKILTDPNATFGKNEHTIKLPPNSTIEVALIGGADHPFHLHGHAFSVIQSASGGAPNYTHPPRRDTVVTASNKTNDPAVRIRFRTDNPGPWFLHCHNDWHLEAGLAVVFAEDPDGMCSGPHSIRPDPEWDELCEIYNKLPESER